MAVEVRELIESRESNDQGDTGDVKNTTRVFQVDTTQDLALGITGVPLPGEPLPWDTDQTVTSRTSRYESGSRTTSRVWITYSTAGGTTWGGNNPADPNFKSWTLSYYDTEVLLPYAYRNPFALRYRNQSGQSVSLDTFPVEADSHWESRKKFIRRLRITNFYITQWEQVGAQANKLHKIGGLWYKFSVGDIQEIARNVWDVSYTWEYDPGTPNILPVDSTVHFPKDLVSTLYPNGGIAGDGKYGRPPFTTIYTIPGYDPGPPPTPFWPTFKAKPDHEANANGWQTLPGMSL